MARVAFVDFFLILLLDVSIAHSSACAHYQCCHVFPYISRYFYLLISSMFFLTLYCSLDQVSKPLYCQHTCEAGFHATIKWVTPSLFHHISIFESMFGTRHCTDYKSIFNNANGPGPDLLSPGRMHRRTSVCVETSLAHNIFASPRATPNLYSQVDTSMPKYLLNYNMRTSMYTRVLGIFSRVHCYTLSISISLPA